jgi:hypothetical protein
VDILDGNFTAIMQAEPQCEPFIGGKAGKWWVDVNIELPPLVPGTYYLDFWIGPHNTETFDYIREQISFEIVDSPSVGRSHPYSRDHGFMVPASTVLIRNGGAALSSESRDHKSNLIAANRKR